MHSIMILAMVFMTVWLQVTQWGKWGALHVIATHMHVVAF